MKLESRYDFFYNDDAMLGCLNNRMRFEKKTRQFLKYQKELLSFLAFTLKRILEHVKKDKRHLRLPPKS